MHRDDIAVTNAGELAGFVEDVGRLDAIFCLALEEFQCNGMIQPGVVCLIYLAVRAFSDLADQEERSPGRPLIRCGCGCHHDRRVRRCRPSTSRHGRRRDRAVWRGNVVDLRSMDLGNVGDETKLANESSCFFVMGRSFERVPIDRLTVGDRLEQFVEIV
jgi:hypothetical protein